MDFFSILNSFLKTDKNYTCNYGDILNESLSDDRLKRGMSEQDIAYFDYIKKNNRERIYENCGNNINNDMRIEKPIENIHVSGIGKVIQLM